MAVLDKEPGMIDSDDNADDESEGLLMSNILVNTIKTTVIKIRNGSQSTKGTAQTNPLSILCSALMYLLFHNLQILLRYSSKAFKSAHSTRLDWVSHLLAAMEELGPVGLGLMPPIEAIFNCTT